MNQQDIAYALSKQVPDMERGFTIATSYGDIVVPAGPMADRIARQVSIALRVEDINCERQAARIAGLVP